MKVVVLSVMVCLFINQEINLSEKLKENKLKAINRELSLFQKTGVELSSQPGAGFGILEDVEFEKGIIQIDLLGENNPGRSFIGVAFNIQNDSTYEAVYFRPFNFVSEKTLNREHMIQYTSPPSNEWFTLRDQRTGEFEKEISTPPPPDDWFRTKIKVSETQIEVYVNDIKEPSLVVERLNLTKSDKIGLWVGHNSSGRFKDLSIYNEQH